MTPTRRAFLAVAAVAPGLAGKRRQARLIDTPGEKVVFLAGGQPLFDYQYGRDLPKPFIHPIRTTSGAVVSMSSPPDHLHHRGLMLGWTDIQGHDFWSEPKVTPGPHGRIVHQRFERIDAGSGGLTAVNHWMTEERLLLVERRTLKAHEPEGQLVSFDWISEFTAPAGDIDLTAAKAGYGALGLRFPHSMDGGDVLNSRGTKTIAEANGEAAEWCAYTGRLEDGGRGGVAMLGHPSNPRHPSPFFVMNTPFGYLNAAPTFRDPLRVKKGGIVRLAYRIAVFMGDADAAALSAAARQWAKARL